MTNSHFPVGDFVGPDWEVLAGFVSPSGDLEYGEAKLMASRLRARVVAVDAWLVSGNRLTHMGLADRLGMSGRCLSNHFASQSELYAFPPPELARSLGSATAGAIGWDEVAALTVPVFRVLESNTCGRVLMAGLVRLHRSHPDHCEHDGYFAHALRDSMGNKRPRHTMAIVGLFTDGIRTVFEDWVDDGEPNLEFVAARVAHLIQGPVQTAFDALNTPH